MQLSVLHRLESSVILGDLPGEESFSHTRSRQKADLCCSVINWLQQMPGGWYYI